MMMMSTQSFASGAMDDSSAAAAKHALPLSSHKTGFGNTSTQQQFQASHNYLTSPFGNTTKKNAMLDASTSATLELMQHPLHLTDEERSFQLINKRVGLLAGHMTHQLHQHQQILFHQ